MKKYNLPLLLLGGGGYTIRNVARLATKIAPFIYKKFISTSSQAS